PAPWPAAPARRLRRSGKLAKSRRRGKARRKAVAAAGPLMRPSNLIGGDPKRGDGRRIFHDGSGFGRLSGRWRAEGIGPAWILMKVLDQKVDEAAHLRRKMMTVRVDRVDRVLGLQKFGQHRNETTRFDLVNEQKARRQREPLAVHRRQ